MCTHALPCMYYHGYDKCQGLSGLCRVCDATILRSPCRTSQARSRVPETRVLAEHRFHSSGRLAAHRVELSPMEWNGNTSTRLEGFSDHRACRGLLLRKQPRVRLA